MGGGALSSNVSKLGSKEVSKTCHLERSERSQSNEILRLSPQNDDNRHAELVSASHNETVFSRFTSHFSRKRVAFTLAEGATHVDTCDGKRKIAFTLAEVLITLGIIGVVAALTLPSVIQNYREQQTVAKLKKIYSILNQAMISAVNEYGTLDTWGLRDGDASEGAKLLQDRIFVPNLKIINYCEKLNSCVGGKPYKYITGTEHISYNGNGGYRRLILSDGTTLIYHVSSEDCNSDIPHAWTGCASINVDVDGYYKGPNTFGKDTFSFNVMKNRIVPYGTQTDTPDFQISCNRKNTYGLACTAWVIFNENLDYLHCDDLQWGTKIKCKQ